MSFYILPNMYNSARAGNVLGFYNTWVFATFLGTLDAGCHVDRSASRAPKSGLKSWQLTPLWNAYFLSPSINPKP